MDLRDTLAVMFLTDLNRERRMSPHMTQNDLYKKVAQDTILAYTLADIAIHTRDAIALKKEIPVDGSTASEPPKPPEPTPPAPQGT